jgi:hypothetical protein
MHMGRKKMNNVVKDGGTEVEDDLEEMWKQGYVQCVGRSKNCGIYWNTTE